MSVTKQDSRSTRKLRIRRKLAGTTARPRLTVYKSLKHIYAQVVDGDKKADAKRVGALIATKCKAVKVDAVVFDRNGFPYHGRIAAVAEAAREAGLTF